MRQMYRHDRQALEAAAAEQGAPMYYEKPSGGELVHMAVADLRSRRPDLSEIEAVRQIGEHLQRQVNAGDGYAADHFRRRR